MVGGCGTSEKLCYFCREHEMRPLPTGKQGENRKKKIQGAFRLLDVTWETFQTTHRLVIWEGWPDGCGCIHSSWLRWTVLPEFWKSIRVLSLLLINIFHQVGRRCGESEGWGGVTKGKKQKGGGGDWGGDLLKHLDWKLDLWISSFSSLQLPVSPSHVMCNSRKDHSPSCHVMGFSSSLCDLEAPHHSLLCEAEGLIKVKKVKNPHKFNSVHQLSPGLSQSLYHTADTTEVCGFVARFACNSSRRILWYFFFQRGQIIIENGWVNLWCLSLHFQ